MGETTVETEDAFVTFEHIQHGALEDIDFSPEARKHGGGKYTTPLNVDPKRVDLILPEGLGQCHPNNPAILSKGLPNMSGDSTLIAEEYGLDMIFVDVPSTKEYRAEIDVKPMSWEWYVPGLVGVGVGAAGVGLAAHMRRKMKAEEMAPMSVRQRKAREEGLPRRRALMYTIVGTGVVIATAAGVAMWEVHRGRSRPSDRRWERLMRDGEIPFDDPDRISISDDAHNLDSPAADLRSVVAAVKIKQLAREMRDKLGRKPRLYMRWGMAHTRILDYLTDPKKLEEGIQRWSGKTLRYLQGEWLDAVTQWIYKPEDLYCWETITESRSGQERLATLIGKTYGIHLGSNAQFGKVNEYELQVADSKKEHLIRIILDAQLKAVMMGGYDIKYEGTRGKPTFHPKGDPIVLPIKTEGGKTMVYQAWHPTVRWIKNPELDKLRKTGATQEKHEKFSGDSIKPEQLARRGFFSPTAWKDAMRRTNT
ncbi:MAG: hypothetical protein V1703_03695 [Candidatus Altiarchaeota archaeon]